MAYSWKKARMDFEKEQSAHAETMRSNSISEETIQDWRDFCRKQLNGNRAFYENTTSIYDEIGSKNDCESVLKHELIAIVGDKEDTMINRNNWIDEINNEELRMILIFLSREDKELLSLFFYDGMTSKEIAKIFGNVPCSTIRSRKNKLLKDIKRSLVNEKTPKQYKRIICPSKPIEVTLCRKCAETFFEMKDHKIKRVDRNQNVRDTCMFCNRGSGFDYLVWDCQGCDYKASHLCGRCHR